LYAELQSLPHVMTQSAMMLVLTAAKKAASEYPLENDLLSEPD